MIYYTELIMNNQDDNGTFGPLDPLDGTAKWSKPFLNTAMIAVDAIAQEVLSIAGIDKPDKPQLLHCLPQNIAELVEITMAMTDSSDGSSKTDRLTDALTSIKDLMKNEKCNVYIINSEVRINYL